MPRKKKIEAKESEDAAKPDEDKKKRLLERAKELVKRVDEEEEKSEEKLEKAEEALEKAEELKKKEIESKEFDFLPKDKRHKLIVPLEEYVKSGIHLGTKVISPHMRQYVYRRRADGLAILNTNLIDEKMREAAQFISKYKPEGIILVCKREAGWAAAKKLSEATGIRVFTKKYPAGIITNSALENFFEPELVIIVDPWLDKNALHDAKILKIPLASLCDTNNLTSKIDVVLPCNNKGAKSIGLVFYILAREFCKKHEKEFSAEIKDFTGE